MAVKKKKPLSKTAKAKREAAKKRALKFRVVGGFEGEFRTKKVYKQSASKVDEETFKLLVKAANERLRQIENKGLTAYSREYQLVKKYAEEYPEGKGAIYNVNEKTGAIRFSRNLTKFMTREKPFKSQGERRAYMIDTLRNFMNAESSTIKGIKAIQKRGFEAFTHEWTVDKKGRRVWKKKEKYKDLTEEQYSNFWKIYRENVQDSKEDHYGYDSLKIMIDHSDIMQMSEEKLLAAMDVIESTRNIAKENVWVAAENVKEIFGEDLAWNFED